MAIAERDAHRSDEHDTLVQAVAQDLILPHDDGEGRLRRIEAQTHALAEAVIAISGTAPTVGPAIKAVKAEM